MVVLQEERGDDLPSPPFGWCHPFSPPGGPQYPVPFSLENYDQPSGSIVSTAYFASDFFILPQLRLGSIKK